MNLRYIATAAFVVLLGLLAACTKNNISKIPQISYVAMAPDSIQSGNGFDTLYIQFNMKDGDADLGNDQSGTQYDIYVKDMRFDSAYVGYFFPTIDQSIENANTGIEGTCIFKLLGVFIVSRTDTLHTKYGDTTQYQIYIKDRAGNESNHIFTPNVYIRP